MIKKKVEKMNSEICPSCKSDLHSHSNKQISECIKNQLEQFRKQKETLTTHSGKAMVKEASQGIGGAIIA